MYGTRFRSRLEIKKPPHNFIKETGTPTVKRSYTATQTSIAESENPYQFVQNKHAA